MTLTVLDVIKDIMNLINATDMDETPTNSEVQLAIKVLNIMLDRLSAQRLMIRSTTLDSKVLTAMKATYTIGTGGVLDWNTAKPLSVLNAYVRDSSGTDTPVGLVDQITYDNIGDKSFAYGRPYVLCYDPGASQQSPNNWGTIQLYTLPDQAYTLYMESDKYLTEFVNPTDIITFESAYYEMIHYNGAERLFRYFHPETKAIPNDIIELAKTSRRVIENMNAVQYTANMDIPGKVSSFNIYSGLQNS